MDSREALIEGMYSPEHYRMPTAELHQQQLKAAQQLFERRVTQIPLLKRRADEAGIGRIDRFEDLVPLLFPHTAYKSYPQGFVERGQWKRLLEWTNGLAVDELRGIDMEGVENIDDWVGRIWAAGHELMATSGTSGKCSFLVRSLDDRARVRRYMAMVMGEFVGLHPNADRPVFQLFPPDGPNNGVQAARITAELWGRPGETHFLGDEPLRISEVIGAARLRARMSRGEATPEEIGDFETAAAARSDRMQARLQALVERIIAHRHEPVFIAGQWAQHWVIMQTAQAMGIADGEFHPDSLVAAGGGLKGLNLPEDYEAQISRFYGPVKRPKNYGMTEMSLLMPRCEAQRYHLPAALIALVLNDEGDAMLPQEGVVEGRFAFLDLQLDGRWGGLISGDRVRMDFSERCACGRRGPTLHEPITRHAPPGQDDHIGCAGTIDAYLRGAVNA